MEWRLGQALRRKDQKIGRISAGEIRPAPRGQERLREAATHGFLRAIVPKANAPKKLKIGEMEVVAVERLSEAIDAVR